MREFFRYFPKISYFYPGIELILGNIAHLLHLLTTQCKLFSNTHPLSAFSLSGNCQIRPTTPPSWCPSQLVSNPPSPRNLREKTLVFSVLCFRTPTQLRCRGLTRLANNTRTWGSARIPHPRWKSAKTSSTCYMEFVLICVFQIYLILSSQFFQF